MQEIETVDTDWLNMEFVEMKESAERWLGEHNSKFKLTAADENENRLIFSTPDTKTSFNITCPNKGEAWVWHPVLTVLK